MAADSTMLRMVNLLIALSLGVHREQLEQRMGLTWPRPFLLRPLELCQNVHLCGNGGQRVLLGSALLDHDGLCGWSFGGLGRRVRGCGNDNGARRELSVWEEPHYASLGIQLGISSNLIAWRSCAQH